MELKKRTYLLIVSVIFFYGCTEKTTPEPILSNSDYFIAHAGGIIDGHIYTNSLEGFEASVSRGYKFIEIDLGLTCDSFLVAVHNWKQFNQFTGYPQDSLPVSKADFVNRKILEKYTPLTAEDITYLLSKYPHVILVADKISSPDILNKSFFDIRERIYVEAFSVEDYIMLKKNRLYSNAFDSPEWMERFNLAFIIRR